MEGGCKLLLGGNQDNCYQQPTILGDSKTRKCRPFWRGNPSAFRTYGCMIEQKMKAGCFSVTFGTLDVWVGRYPSVHQYRKPPSACLIRYPDALIHQMNWSIWSETSFRRNQKNSGYGQVSSPKDGNEWNFINRRLLHQMKFSKFHRSLRQMGTFFPHFPSAMIGLGMGCASLSEDSEKLVSLGANSSLFL